MHTWRLPPVVTAWVMLLVIETLGQIALKTAGGRIGPFELDWSSIRLALQTPWLWLGLACYLGQFVVWMVILEKSALSAAFPTSAIVFVAVMIASRVVFGDALGWEKVLGSVIIVTGILLLGSDVQASPPVSSDDASDWNSA
jgi:drug/metabolite transporter (DMT)-like permease